MGASCGQIEIHGASNDRPPPLCTNTFGPWACMCLPRAAIPEGTQILEVGSGPGKLVLRAQEDDLMDVMEVEDLKRQLDMQSSGLKSAKKELENEQQQATTDLSRASASSAHEEAQGFRGSLSKVKHWMQDHSPLAHFKLQSGAHAASYLHPLAAAVLKGRVIEACRLIEEMENSGEEKPRQFFRGHGDGNPYDRIRRVGTKYEHSLEEMKNSVGMDYWFSEEDNLDGPRVELSVEHGMLQTVSVSQHKDFEILKAFAALCEVDYLRPYTEAEWAREQVEEIASRADESFLHVVKDRERKDSILQATYADALEESLKMLWVCIDGQEVPTDVDTHHGVVLPSKPGVGYERVSSSVTTYAIVPMKHASRTGLFRLIIVQKTPLSLGSQCWYGILPSCSSRSHYRKKMSQFLEGLKRAAQSDSLTSKMQESPRAAFYEQVRRHMESLQQKKRPSRTSAEQLALKDQ
mmetsp:Transcript_87167/g.164388  ORF Transcript_87167/g.164388 Transcript_87167/m.164388 type:complete len:464 (-) Transcript_87167:16-1407(-)